MSSLPAMLLLGALIGQQPKTALGKGADELCMAIQFGDRGKVKALLAQNPAFAKAKGELGYPLDMAARMRKSNVFDLLIAAGAELNIESATSFGMTKKVAEMLKEKPWLAKAPNKPLHDAVERGYLDIVKLLLEHGANPNQDYGFSNVTLYTPLSAAVRYDHFEIAKLLCENGAKPEGSIGKGNEKLFHYAVAHCEPRFVKLLLDYNADPDEVNRQGITPLQTAAIEGDVEKARLLVDAHANIDATTDDGASALLFAVATDHPDFGNFLASRGAKFDIYSACALGKYDEAAAILKAKPELVNSRNRRLQRTPLLWAAKSDNKKLVELLVSSRAEVNVHAPPFGRAANVIEGPRIYDDEKKSNRGTTPLHEAAAAGHADIVRYLVSKGAQIEAKDNEVWTALHLACRNRHPSVIKALIENGADLSARGYYQATPLFEAVSEKECVDMLLAAKADPNVKDGAGISPLLQAAYSGYSDTVETLLVHGAKLDLYSACLLGKLDAVKKFIDEDPKKLDAPIKDYRFRQETPLMLAARGGQADVVEFLVSRGAEYRPAKLQFSSPIMIAATYGREKVVKWFLDKGVPVDASPQGGETGLFAAVQGGETALFAASRSGQPNVVRLLLQYKADPNSKLKYYAETPLHAIGTSPESFEDRYWGSKTMSEERKKVIAERRKREADTVRVLLEGDANVDARNEAGQTPLSLAAERGMAEVAAVLIEKGADVNARDCYDRTPLWAALNRSEFRDKDRDPKPVIELLRQHGAKE